MAEPELQRDGPAAMSGILGWIGAACSAVLVGGCLWWAWDLATRDARGVPVVRALAGPMAVPPDDPGGYRAEHQGLSVNSVASDGQAPPVSERITLAPEPTGLAEDDRPAPKLLDPSDPATIRDSVDQALAEIRAALGGDPAPSGDAVPPTGAPAHGPDAAEPHSATRPGDELTPRPAMRPDPDLVTRASFNLGRPDDAALQNVDLSPGTLPPGTRLVQLGAHDSLAQARLEWERLDLSFADYMNGKRRVIEEARIGEQSFYRLRAHGFADLAEAKNFCAALIAEQADCVPVLTR